MALAIPLSIVSGLLLTVGFPSLEYHWVSWCAFLPLFLAIKDRKAKDAFKLGYLCGLAHFLTTLYWIRYVVYHYGGLPFPVALAVLLLLCAYLAFYPAVFAFMAQRWQGRTLLWIFGLPCLWVTLEWARAHALTGFPWANLGYTQGPMTTLVQIADITGAYGLSWLIVLGNTILWAVLMMVRKERRVILLSAAVFLACTAGALIYGSWRMGEIDRLQQQAPAWTVGLAQGNVDQSKKWDPEFQQETLRRYRELSLQAMTHTPRPSLLVWPETAMPFFYGIEEKLTLQVNGILGEIGEPVLFGSPAVSVVDGQARLQNRAYILDAGGNLRGSYAKQHLVPFGEYVPLQKILFFVHRLVQAAGDFVPGHSTSPLPLDKQKLGVLICYEGIFPGLARQVVAQDATALVNITNDAWYGDTSAPYQHMEIARWRAIEFRVPLIRAANTGISTFFDAKGQSLGIIPLNHQGYLVATLHPFPIITFYARWGDLFAWGCVLTAVVGALFSMRRRPSLILD